MEATYAPSANVARKMADSFRERLRNAEGDAKVAAAKQLFRYVNGDLKDEKSGFVDEFLSALDGRTESSVYAAINSASIDEKRCGIFLIVCLAEHQTGGVIRYANYLLKTLSVGTMDEETIKFACRALAYLIQTSKSYAPEQVDRSLEHCMEWLQETSRNEGRRLAAVHLSREIAIFTPTAFFLRANIFFEYIFNAFKDPVPTVRIAAIDAMHAVLSITSQRESKQKKDWYKKCFDAVIPEDPKAKLVKDKTVKPDEIFHSMALILNELMRIADSTFEKVLLEASYSDKKKEDIIDPIDWIVTARYPQTVECSTLRQTIKDRLKEVIVVAERIIGMDAASTARAAAVNRSVHLNVVLMQMLPRICAYNACTAEFHKLAIDTACHVLPKQSCAALALGLMMMANPTLHRPRLPLLLNHVRDQLSMKKKQDDNYFRFLYLIVDAYNEDITNEIQNLLPVLLKSTLSRGLTNVLKMIMMRIPKLRLNVQDGVMAAVYQNLTGSELPSKSEPIQKNITPKVNMATENVAEIERIVLSIDTLGEFYFSRGALQRIMQFVANYYLVVEQVPIRLAAVKCCCDMVIPFVEVFDVVTHDRRQNQLEVIHGVLNSLVAVIVVDPSVDVRLKVVKTLREMSPKFLVHLAQPEMLEVIFMALHDERLEMQEACVSLLGRLSELNPALVFPRMRRMLLETLSQLTNSGQARLELHSAKLVALVAQQSPKFIRPYIGSLLTALIPKLRGELKYADVTVQVLNAVSELAVIGGAELVRSIDQLFKRLTVMVTDSSSLQRREAALRAIGRICRSTAYVVDPYKEYPSLLDDLLRLLKTVMSSSVRREAIKTLGILGAIDPYMHKVFTGSVQSALARSTALSQPVPRNDLDPRQHISQWFNYEKCTLEEYYPAITIANLMQMIQDDAYASSYREIAQALLTIFRSLGEANMQYIEQVVPQLLRACEARSDLKAFFLRQLSIFVAVIEDKALPYMKDIFTLIAKAWQEDKELQITVIESLETMGATLKLEFSSYIGELIPYFLEVLQTDKTKDRGLTTKVMGCLKPLSNCLTAHLHLVLPPVLMIMDDPAIPVPCRAAALSTALHFAKKMDISAYAPRMIQSWNHSIHIVSMQENLCRLLLEIIKQLPRHYKVYRRSIEIKVDEHRLKNFTWFSEEYRTLTQKAMIAMEARDTFMVNGQAPWKKEETENLAHNEGGNSAETYEHFGRATKEMEVQRNPNEINTTKISKQRVNYKDIMQTMNVDTLSSREEWAQWLQKTRTIFLKSSSSPSLRAASAIADQHQHLSKDLFHASFMSVWTEMDQTQQDRLTRICLAALNSGQTDVIQTVLNLAEFMAHSEKGPLPIGAEKLGKCAEETRAYAKALRYKELQILKRWAKNKDNLLYVDDCQALINFANKLNVQEEAAGVVRYAERNNMNIPMQGRWYEKLNEWEKALESYDIEKVSSDDITMHEMRCLEALGKWERLNEKASKFKEKFDQEGRPLDHKVAVIAARGAWAIGNWDKVAEYVSCIGENTQDGVLLRAVIAVHNNEHEVAEALVDKVRDIYDTDLTAMASESYERAYGAMVFVQQMAEIEEAIEYKVRPERRPRIALLWSRRLQGIRQNVEQWQRLLMLRGLVLTPTEMHPLRVKFASLCRKRGKQSMSRSVLRELLNLCPGEDLLQASAPYDKPQLVLALCKQLWVDEHRQAAIATLEGLARHLDRLQKNHSPEAKRLCAKVFLKLGEWTDAMCLNRNSMASSAEIAQYQSQPPIIGRQRNPAGSRMALEGPFDAMETMIAYYQKATTYDDKWHKAWHKLAFAFFYATSKEKDNAANAKLMPSRQQLSPLFMQPPLPPFGPTPMPLADLAALDHPGCKIESPLLVKYVTNAIECFCKALRYAPGSHLQDTLRLLQLWFEFGSDPTVNSALKSCVAELPMATWLEVVPQLMARLDSSEGPQVELVKKVLIDICKQQPQSLLYPLTVASKSEKPFRARNAKDILLKISEFHKTLVDDAALVSEELVRCAILWHEKWYDALEEAGRVYFTFMNNPETDMVSMFENLLNLHKRLNRNQATTLKEMSFNQTYSADLAQAVRFSEDYLRTRNMKEMNQAWEAYCLVFKKLRDQMNNLTSLDLNYISPKLMRAKDLELAVPGTYDPSAVETVRISYFYTRLVIITSKQRPRKMVIRGSNGLDYTFLLKGHEDPRQDERVMQLFGLVNTLLANNTETSRRNLTIQRYSIVALSRESGLIGWMPNCDTLHALVKEYREKKAKISLSMEHKKLQSMTADTERLTLMQKLQLFEMALQETKGDDLRQILWLKSPSSEVWFDRRTNYTRSIACMSMVGYILGLGDRHPSNLMLDRLTGKIVHIDFGDCFEVAMQREKFPEKIPFRLTRMLINAMEITGIEGTFRLTCESVLKVLRANRESLMAVLEAFVYDPVINWRLIEGNRRGPDEKRDPSKLKIQEAPKDVSNSVINKIRQKLTGSEFDASVEVTISDQLDRLVDQATDHVNLCQCYIGWCPFW